MKEGLMIVTFVVGCMFLLVAFSSFTGLSVLNDVAVDDVEQGDDVMFLASVNNSAGEKVSVWASIWDNTGGLIWSGLMSIISGANTDDEKWGANISNDTPPFPEVEGEETFDYVVSMNDSAGNVVNKTGSFVVREKEELDDAIVLKKGWNMVAFSFSDSDVVSDKKIALNRGWNLVGYSSKEVPSEDVSVSATVEGVIQGKASYFDSDRGSYQLMSLSEGEFEPNRAYWVFSNSKEPVDMVIEKVGGAEEGRSKPVDELVFRNVKTGEETVGVDDAEFLKGISLRYYTGSGFANVEDNVNSWEGYFILSPNDDYVILE